MWKQKDAPRASVVPASTPFIPLDRVSRTRYSASEWSNWVTIRAASGIWSSRARRTAREACEKLWKLWVATRAIDWTAGTVMPSLSADRRKTCTTLRRDERQCQADPPRGVRPGARRAGGGLVERDRGRPSPGDRPRVDRPPGEQELRRDLRRQHQGPVLRARRGRPGPAPGQLLRDHAPLARQLHRAAE